MMVSDISTIGSGVRACYSLHNVCFTKCLQVLKKVWCNRQVRAFLFKFVYIQRRKPSLTSLWTESDDTVTNCQYKPCVDTEASMKDAFLLAKSQVIRFDSYGQLTDKLQTINNQPAQNSTTGDETASSRTSDKLLLLLAATCFVRPFALYLFGRFTFLVCVVLFW